MKLTKRKGFNFYRSYFDIYNELTDKCKLEFIDALLNKQFLNEDPKELKGMSKFAYLSQLHSIEKQVKGYEDATGIRLNDTPNSTPKGTPKGTPTSKPLKEEEEQQQEQEKDKRSLFDTFWDLYDKKTGKEKSLPKFLKLSINEIEKILNVVPIYVKNTPDKKFRKDPLTYLNGKHWNDEITTKKEEQKSSEYDFLKQYQKK